MVNTAYRIKLQCKHFPMQSVEIDEYILNFVQHFNTSTTVQILTQVNSLTNTL